MTAEALAARAPAYRRCGRGWIARCPAHDDRQRSLSISSGREGRVLVKCFAGCDFDTIVAAFGLQRSDLFAAGNVAHVERVRRQASAAEIRAFIEREVERQRDVRLERYPYDQPGFRSSDVNAARERANALFNAKLLPIARYAWEGWAPHDQDPEWPMLFERALLEIRWQWWGIEPTAATSTPRMALRAGDLAAQWLRALPRCA